MVQFFYVIQLLLAFHLDCLEIETAFANAKNEQLLFLDLFSIFFSMSFAYKHNWLHVQLSLITLAHNFAFRIGNLDGVFVELHPNEMNTAFDMR